MSNFASLIFYLISFSVAVSLIGYGIKRGYRAAIGIGLAIPIIISSLRFDVGTDYLSYLQIFNSISDISINEFIRDYSASYELGVYLIAKFSSLFPYAQNIYFGIFATGTILFTYLGLKRYKLPHVWVILFLYLLILFPMSFNLVRQMLAVSIFFYATSFIQYSKFLKFTILIVLAALFHKSVIVLLPVYFVGKALPSSRILRNQTLVITILMFLLFIVLGKFTTEYILDLTFFEKYDKYQVASQASAGVLLATKIATLGIITIFMKNINEYKHFAFFYVMGVFEVLILVLAINSVDLSRFSIYFSIFPIILITYVASSFNRSGRFVIFPVMLMYAISFFWITYLLKGGSEIFPYQIMLQKVSL